MKYLCCESPNLRTSRFRPSDLPRILLFQYPVRCRTCHLRYFANIFSAWKLPNRTILCLVGGRARQTAPAARPAPIRLPHH